MIKSLLDAELRDGLPRVLQKQPWVEALSRAVLDLHRQTMGFIDGSQIYTAIDTVSEAVLDALAVSGRSTGTTRSTTWSRSGGSCRRR